MRHGRWYLVCWSHAAGGRRAYRIDRVQQVEVLPGGFDPPAPFDPVAVLEEHLSVGWEYTVELHLDAPVESVAARVPRTLGRLEALDGGTCRLVGTTGNPWWFAGQLVTIPVPFRIVGGPELRHTAGVLGRRLLDASSGDDDQESGSSGPDAATSVDGNRREMERR